MCGGVQCVLLISVTFSAGPKERDSDGEEEEEEKKKEKESKDKKVPQKDKTSSGERAQTLITGGPADSDSIQIKSM